MLEIPSTCPVCASDLERVNDQLFCRNENCDAKHSKKIAHFVKVMKIKGLGEKTLEKINLEDILDLYNLSLEDLTTTLGEKIGTKIFQEITKSKQVPLSIFIQSFGIPLIGNSASMKLSKHTDSLWNINEDVCKKAGLGNKATENILKWIHLNEDLYSSLPIETESNSQTEIEEQFKVCVTGKLNDFSSRNKAKEFLETRGVTVLSSVSSKVKYLICDEENSSSSSFVKAEKMNIPIITMNQLLNILNGEN